jgi:hypothetical protein
MTLHVRSVGSYSTLLTNQEYDVICMYVWLLYYLQVGGLGYARFCDHTPHNILGSATPANVTSPLLFTSSSARNSLASVLNWVLYGPSDGDSTSGLLGGNGKSY